MTNNISPHPVDDTAKTRRIRTVEYDPGWGWIARSPFDGRELGGDGFRWRTRDVARTVVLEERTFNAK